MTIVEKAAYLKGLAEGLGVEADSKEGKLWAALNGLLSDIAHEIEDLQSAQLDMSDTIDELGEELSLVEERVFDLDSPEQFDPGRWEADEDEPEDGEEDEDDDEDDEEDEDFDEGEDEPEDEEEEEDGEDEEVIDLPRFDSVMYDVTCPVCGTEITLDEEMLAEGSIDCPGCGETLEFDLQDEEET